MAEIATAYVSLVPSFQGGGKAISSQLAPAAAAGGLQAGKTAGGRFGSSFRGSVKSSVGSFATIMAGLGVSAFVGDTVRQFEGMNRSIQVGTGATGDALDGLVESARSVGGQVPDQFGAVGESLANLNGYTDAAGETLEGLTKQVLDASRMLGEDGVSNSEAFGKAMRQWQIPADEGEEALDSLFVATQEYGVGLDGLSGHLTTYGSVLKNAGFSMAESADLFGRLEHSGMSVSRVMPGLNSAFRKWAGEGKNSREELARVVEAMRSTGDETEALAIATETFGAEGAQRLTTEVMNGSFALDDLGDSLADSSGAVEKSAADSETMGEKWGRIQNQFRSALLPTIDRLLDAFDTFAPVIEGVLSAIGPMTPILVPLAAGIGAVTVATWAMNAALLANPITWVIGAIVALIGILVWAYNEFDWFKDMIDAVWGFIKDSVGGAIGWITDDFVPALVAAWDWVVDKAVWVKDGVVSAWNTLSGAVSGAVDRIKGFLSGMWDVVTSGAKGALNGAIRIINGAIGGLNSLINTANRIPGVNIPNIGKIPMLAEGGIVTRPTLAMVGEGGESEAVIPLSKLDSVVGGGGEVTVVVDGRGLPRALKQWLSYAVRTQSAGSVQGLLGRA